jgi:hypothetical protein
MGDHGERHQELAGVLSVARGALDARQVAPQHTAVAESIGV